MKKKSQNAEVSKGMLYICLLFFHSQRSVQTFFSWRRIRSTTIDGGAFGFSGRNRAGHAVEVSISHAYFFISSSLSERLKIRPRFYLREHQGTDPGESASDGANGADVEVREVFLLFLFCCRHFTPITKSVLLNFTREGEDLGEKAVLFFVSTWSSTCNVWQWIQVVGLR